MFGPPPAGSAGSRPSLFRRRGVLAGVAVAVVLLVAGYLVLRSRPGTPVVDEGAYLEAKAAALQTQLELVKEEARYLLLDPHGGTLTLFHAGAPLRTWPVLEVEAGARRMGEEEEGWRSRRWDGARIEPIVERDRRVILSDSVEPPDLTGEVDWIPPTPEEAIPTPPRFVVHYLGGLGLEVLAIQTDSVGAQTPLLDRVEHRLRRWMPSNWDRYRIRIAMPAADAGTLYRALPDSSSLLAVIPRR